MSIRNLEVEIDPRDPFKGCALERKKYANVLTQIINLNAQGFVLALNNQWGSGKTTFVKMWQAELELQDYKTVYFNAWENDFEHNPLVALISELKALIGQNEVIKKEFNNVLKNGKTLAKNIVPQLVKTFAKKHLGDDYADLIESTAKGVSEVFDDEIDLYLKKKEGIKEFRTALAEFVSKSIKSKPLIFIVDELDRCRPHYTVELLEQIKHLFSVNGVVFVLSIDKMQLKHAIGGVYGSEHIDTEQYLKRFIDVEYSIPEPKIELYPSFLINTFDFSPFYSQSITSDKDSFLEIVTIIFAHHQISLREQEKIIIQTKLCCTFFKNKKHFFPSLIFILVFIKTKKVELYNKLKSNSSTSQEILVNFAELVPKGLDIDTLNKFAFLQAILCSIHNNSLIKKENLIVLNGDKAKEYTLISRIMCSKEEFHRYIDSAEKTIERDNLKFSYLVEMVELLEDVKFDT
jgi:GTPase SAR1 family protein